MVVAASLPEDIFRALLQGTPPGAVYALVALGFVLTYKTSGVFNLAFGAQAYVSAAMYFKARIEWEWGILPAVLVSVVVLPPLLGLVLERLIFRHLRQASALPKLVVAIGLSVAIPALFNVLAEFKALSGATPEGVVNDGNSVFYDPFGVYPFSRNELVMMGVAVVAALALGALFRFSAMGLRMRAVVESARMTELNGIAADRVSAFAWILSSFFAGLAGVLIAPRFNTLSSPDFFHLMVVAIAAAAIGRLVSLPRALIGGLGLGWFIALLSTFLPRWVDDYAWLKPLQENLAPAVPFIVLFAVLVFVPSIRRAKEASDPLSGVDPPPPSVGTLVVDKKRALLNTIGGAVFLGIVGAVVLSRGDQRWIFLVTQAVVLAIVYLSITVITGMAGQISLCQAAFAATGAFACFQLANQNDYPVLVGVVVGCVLASASAAVLALPIRKLGGVWTAIATLAFAYFFDAVIVNLSWVGGGETSLFQGTGVPRPSIGPFDLNSDKSFLVFAVVVLAVVATVVQQLKSGTFGRIAVALRGSEVGAQSIGISPARARMVAFAISGFIAALGGSMMAMHQENVNYGLNFTPAGSLFWVVIVVTLGSRRVSGAMHAGAAFSLFTPLILQGEVFGWILRSEERIPWLFPLPGEWMFVLFGLGAIQFARHPEGVIEYNLHKRAIKAERKRVAKLDGGSPPGEVVSDDARAQEPVS